MQHRNNHLHAEIVNKGLIMVYIRGVDEAKCMMMRAGLPPNVINRVLIQYNLIEKSIRKTDFQL